MKGTRIVTASAIVLLLLASALHASSYRTDRIIVKFRQAVPGTASAVAALSSRPVAIAVDDAQKAIAELEASGEVEYAEPDYIIEAEEVPSDWPYRGQWAQLAIEQAWDLFSSSGGSSSVIVAVVDSGVDFSHPDLSGVLVKGYDFVAKDDVPEDNSGHGTKVCGVLGAVGGNGIGIAGVAWEVDLAVMPLKFMDTDSSGKTTGNLSDAIKAIYYAVDHGARIINASWGFYDYSRSLEEAIEYARSKGVLVVCSAGNKGQDNDVLDHYPSNYPQDNIVAVAALGTDGTLAAFSNYGVKNVDVAAPGVGLVTTTLNGGYASWVSGTSYSTPFVSGVAAMLLATDDTISPEEARDILIRSCSQSPQAASFAIAGLGCINAFEALALAGSHDETSSQDSGGEPSRTAEGSSDQGMDDGGSSGGSGCLISTAAPSPSIGMLLPVLLTIVLFRTRRTGLPE
ncbi:MAG TPA: S8 family peptidase [Deltaproteobacteria bacterium]|nr:S8 family peptidase [Deltaproteobacteria bacterium]